MRMRPLSRKLGFGLVVLWLLALALGVAWHLQREGSLRVLVHTALAGLTQEELRFETARLEGVDRLVVEGLTIEGPHGEAILLGRLQVQLEWPDDAVSPELASIAAQDLELRLGRKPDGTLVSPLTLLDLPEAEPRAEAPRRPLGPAVQVDGLRVAWVGSAAVAGRIQSVGQFHASPTRWKLAYTPVGGSLARITLSGGSALNVQGTLTKSDEGLGAEVAIGVDTVAWTDLALEWLRLDLSRFGNPAGEAPLIDGRLEATADLALSRTEAGEPKIEARAVLTSERLRSPLSPLPIEGLATTWSLEAGLLVLEEGRAKVAGAELVMEGRFGEGPDTGLTIFAEDLQLTDGFVATLDGRLRQRPVHPLPEIYRQLRAVAVRGPVDLTVTTGAHVEDARRRALGYAIRVDLKEVSVAYFGHPDREGRIGASFAYPFKGVSGTVLIDDEGLLCEDLRSEGQPYELQGEVSVDWSLGGDETYTIDLGVTDLAVEPALVRQLAPRTRSLIERLNAEGRVNVVARMERRRGDPTRVPIDVSVELLGLQARPTELPFAFEDLRGTILSENDEIRTKGVLRAKRGAATLELSGRIADVAGDDSFELKLAGKAWRADDSLIAGLRPSLPEIAGALEDIGLRGALGEFAFHIKRGPSGGRSAVTGRVRLDGASVAPRGLAVQAEACSGTLLVANDGGGASFTLSPDFQLRWGGQAFGASGRLGSDGAFRLHFENEALRFDPTLMREVERLAPALAGEEVPVLSGEAALALDVAGELKGEVGVDLTLELDGVKAAFPRRGFDLQDLRGSLSWSRGGPLLLKGWSGLAVEHGRRPLPGDARVVGELFRVAAEGPDDGAAGPQLTLQGVKVGPRALQPWMLVSTGLVASAAVLPAMSAQIEELGLREIRFGTGEPELRGLSFGLREVQLGEDASTTIGRLRAEGLATRSGYERGLGGALIAQDITVAEVQVPLLRARLTVAAGGVLLQDCEGALFGWKPVLFDSRKASDAALRRALAREAPWPMRRIRALSRPALIQALAEEAARSPSLRTEAQLRTLLQRRALLEPAASRPFPRQTLVALVEASRSRAPIATIGRGSTLALGFESRSYTMSLSAEGIDIGPATRTFGEVEDPVNGVGRITVELEGQLGELSSWVGSGRLEASLKDLVKLPLALELFQSLDLGAVAQRGQSAAVSARFALRDQRVSFGSARIEFNTLRMQLQPPGTLGFDQSLDLTFSVRHRAGFPILSHVVQFIPSLLLQEVRITGSLDQPRVDGGRRD